MQQAWQQVSWLQVWLLLPLLFSAAQEQLSVLWLQPVAWQGPWQALLSHLPLAMLPQELGPERQPALLWASVRASWALVRPERLVQLLSFLVRGEQARAAEAVPAANTALGI